MTVRNSLLQIALFVWCCTGAEVVAVQNAIGKPAFGADPIIGTWKLNIARSRLISLPAYNMTPPKEQTESYRVIDGGRIERTSMTTMPDGSTSLSALTWPAEGGPVQIQRVAAGVPPNISYFEVLIAPGEWYVVTMFDGRQVGTRHKVVSKDGKTMQQTVKLNDPQGKAVEQLEVYDRK